MLNLIKPFILFFLVLWISTSILNIVRAGNTLAAIKSSVMTVSIWGLIALVMLAVGAKDFVAEYKHRQEAERAPLVENYTYWKKRCDTAPATFKTTACKSASDAKLKLDQHDQK